MVLGSTLRVFLYASVAYVSQNQEIQVRHDHPTLGRRLPTRQYVHIGDVVQGAELGTPYLYELTTTSNVVSPDIPTGFRPRFYQI